MKRCRICRSEIPELQMFCTSCGVRQTPEKLPAKRGVLGRLEDFFWQTFRSEAWKRFDAAIPLGRYAVAAVIPGMEEALKLDPQNHKMKSILAICYVGAAEESIHMGGSLWNALAAVAEVRRVEEDTEHGYAEYARAWEWLDKAFHGALTKFDRSLYLVPGYSRAYSVRAKAFQDAADDILLHAYRISPTYMEYRRDPSQDKEGATVRHGSAILGVCLTEETPVLRFADEIIWLYEHAEEDYREALSLDPTDAESFVNLSHVLRQLGKEKEAEQNLYKALAILNKATEADDTDEKNYSERAAILEEMGEVDGAIADLERVLTLTSSEFTVDSTKQKLEALRKQNEAAAEGG